MFSSNIWTFEVIYQVNILFSWVLHNLLMCCIVVIQLPTSLSFRLYVRFCLLAQEHYTKGLIVEKNPKRILAISYCPNTMYSELQSSRIQLLMMSDFCEAIKGHVWRQFREAQVSTPKLMIC